MKYIFFALWLALAFSISAFAPPEPETPAVKSPVDRLAAPPLPVNPKQADLGAQVYYQVCMACHGDKGQGLTDEWRAVWGEDSYCWSSKCHGPNHPTPGFEFPQKSSPVIGSGTLLRFDNALELYDYLVKTMPWWNPGYLPRVEYWQVTAFLMREHNGLPANIELDAGNAAVIHLRPASPIQNDSRPATILVIGILAIAAVIVIIEERIRHT